MRKVNFCVQGEAEEDGTFCWPVERSLVSSSGMWIGQR